MHFDRADFRMRQVHEQNLKYAEEAGMTLDDWHKMMSEKGNKPIEQQNTIQPIMTSAEYVWSYLFPKKAEGKKIDI